MVTQKLDGNPLCRRCAKRLGPEGALGASLYGLGQTPHQAANAAAAVVNWMQGGWGRRRAPPVPLFGDTHEERRLVYRLGRAWLAEAPTRVLVRKIRRLLNRRLRRRFRW